LVTGLVRIRHEGTSADGSESNNNNNNNNNSFTCKTIIEAYLTDVTMPTVTAVTEKLQQYTNLK
jgi:hypothetical protein